MVAKQKNNCDIQFQVADFFLRFLPKLGTRQAKSGTKLPQVKPK
jgi:hypothetical protein